MPALFVFQRKGKEEKLFWLVFCLSIALHLGFVLVLRFSGDLFSSGPEIKFDTVEARIVKFGTKKREKRMLPRIYKKKVTAAVKAAKNEKGNSLKPVKKVKKKKKKKIEPVVKKKDVDLASLIDDELKNIKNDPRAEISDEGVKDGAKNGDVTDETLAIKGNLYNRKILRIMKSNWKIPSIVTKEKLTDLKVEISARITFAGELYGMNIEISSGDKVFDSSVVEAIKKTAALPLPTDKKLKKLVLKEGFRWTFVPD